MVKQLSIVIGLLFFCGCTSHKTPPMSSGILNHTDFQHAVQLDSRVIKTAVFSEGRLYVSTAQKAGFSLVSTADGKIEGTISENRILGGLFAGHGKSVYAPIYNKLFHLKGGESQELLTDMSEQMFGVKDVHISEEFLFVVAHNGVFVFEQASQRLLASFPNTSKSTVSALNIYFNPNSKRLYIANLRDGEDDRGSVVCADGTNDFKTIWRVRLPGQLAASAGDFAVNQIFESEAHLLVPVVNAERKPALLWLEKENGSLANQVELYSSRDLVYAGKSIYAKAFSQGKMACLDLSTGENKWTADIGSEHNGTFLPCQGKLYLSRSDRKTSVVDMGTGQVTVSPEKVNFRNVLDADLRPSQRFFVVDSYLCWD